MHTPKPARQKQRKDEKGREEKKILKATSSSFFSPAYTYREKHCYVTRPKFKITVNHICSIFPSITRKTLETLPNTNLNKKSCEDPQP